MATEVKLTITLEAALAARLSAAATEHGWSAARASQPTASPKAWRWRSATGS